jgi:hypothetical protein
VTNFNTPKIIDVSLERAYDIIGELQEKGEHETDGIKVVWGTHTELGAIYVVITPIGNPTLLPVVIQSLDL